MIVLNGNYLEREVIHLDKGFLYGCGVFETILIRDGKPVFLKEHLKRLIRGLEVLKINQPMDEFSVLAQMKKLQVDDCVLRISVSDENILYTKRPLTYTNADYDKGFSVKVSEMTRNPKSHITYIKSLNYIDNGIERERAQEAGFNEALFLNPEGFVTEGTTTNLFFVKNNVLHTPSMACGLLPGVMRGWICERFTVVEGQFTLADVLESDGVFMTNSILGVMRVNRIGAVLCPENGMIVTLQKAYAQLLEGMKDE